MAFADIEFNALATNMATVQCAFARNRLALPQHNITQGFCAVVRDYSSLNYLFRGSICSIHHSFDFTCQLVGTQPSFSFSPHATVGQVPHQATLIAESVMEMAHTKLFQKANKIKGGGRNRGGPNIKASRKNDPRRVGLPKTQKNLAVHLGNLFTQEFVDFVTKYWHEGLGCTK